MNQSFSTTLIITTYNWPEALRLVLESVTTQTVKPDQVVVADDGSGPESGKAVKDVLSNSGLKWCHVRHENNGVRQSRIKNLAVKYSDSGYLIFIDHDVVIHPDFIKDHIFMAQNGYFLQGKRCLLPKEYTNKVINDSSFIPPSFFLKRLGNRKNVLRSRLLSILFSKTKDFETSLRGCNLSMFKSDFIRVDGFDESFDGSWGREDSDICYRLFHTGIKVKNLWFSALQYHLMHDVDSDWSKERLDNEITKNLNEKRNRAVKGFSKISGEGKIIAAS